MSDNRDNKPVVSDSNGDTSMSIEETNRVRATLGLRALDVGDKAQPPKVGSNNNPVDYMAMKAAEVESKKSKELAQKIADMKKHRTAQSKTMASKGLGAVLGDEDEIA
ncbi:hypothetical protein T484DRAFT_1771151 [Baffinella frigidus]|nr:hypothetical protein T484DRAFT_1771151 [Cryptophyta sp. CCMP2293]